MQIDEQKQTIITGLIFALATFMLLQIIFGPSPMQPVQQPAPPPPSVQEVRIPGAMPVNTGIATRQVTVPQEVPLENSHIRGMVELVSGDITDLELLKFRETIQPYSPNVVLLDRNYTVETGLLIDGVPVHTQWRAPKDARISADRPLEITAVFGDVTVRRTYQLDDKYMLRITDKVTNNGKQAVSVSQAGDIWRTVPRRLEAGAVHQGLIGFFNNRLNEVKYDKLEKESVMDFSIVQEGWFGVSDKFWMSAFALHQPANVRFAFERAAAPGAANAVRASFIAEGQSIGPGQSHEASILLFTGAKDFRILDLYRDKFDIGRFDLAIDYGWYYILTRPLLMALSHVNGWVGNMGVTILILALLLRIAMFPITQKAYVNTNRMRELQPKIKQIQEQYAGDHMRIQREMMALYKLYKINPASGCLPLLIQIPVFFALYKVLVISIELRHAPFIWWIHDLSAPDPTSVLTLFGLIPLPLPAFLDIGLWPVLMGATMFLQQKLSPQPTDKVQARIFKFLPLVFTFMLAQFASGLVIYWTWSNILGIIQQKYMTRRHGARP
ncbi:MAG: membrane protein insertase YidC [Alphaproteobacteria bacterium]|nr:membrane protein insertase YidC [Alphaproteobacteria bacterium]